MPTTNFQHYVDFVNQDFYVGLERTGDNTYKSSFEIKLGPVDGCFTGSLLLDDLKESFGFTLKVQENRKRATRMRI